jgi:hypothetical protein
LLTPIAGTSLRSGKGLTVELVGVIVEVGIITAALDYFFRRREATRMAALVAVPRSNLRDSFDKWWPAYAT